MTGAADADRPAIFGRCSALERSDGVALQAVAQRVHTFSRERAVAEHIDAAKRVVVQAAKSGIDCRLTDRC